MIGIYGQRLRSLGSLSLVVLSIFIDGHLTGNNILKSLLIFFSGCLWFVAVFMIVTTLQPYKLAGQMIGENYLELADYLRIKAKFYAKNIDHEILVKQLINQQVKIKDLQEDTREMVFKTRKIVNESTTQSRLLMLMFINSIDLYEKLLTSENDYKKLNEIFGETVILDQMHNYLTNFANEITNLGISLQAGIPFKPNYNFDEELKKIYDDYYDYRLKAFSSKTLEDFMLLRQILMRFTVVTDEIKTILRVFSQDVKLAKSLSTGLDYEKFVPKEEKLNLKVFMDNISLDSLHFRHAIRVTTALLIGYIISRFSVLGIGHAYWILITILAILKPAYSTTKSRNILRFFGTLSGGVLAYAILYYIEDSEILLGILLASMIMCFSLLRSKYYWAVLFMTIYIFLTFNFLKPGNINQIFRDRTIDTAIGSAVTFLVSLFILPVWERAQNLQLMKKYTKSNLEYFDVVMNSFIQKDIDNEDFRLKRKSAIIDLANLSDNFQKMISDPKNQQRKMETVYQFVTTSHLLTAYTASLSQYSNSTEKYPEIDSESWKIKISSEIERTNALLNGEKPNENSHSNSRIVPDDIVIELLMKRKKELDEQDFLDLRDHTKISHLTELKNIRELLELIYNVAQDQRKVIEDYLKYQSETGNMH